MSWELGWGSGFAGGYIGPGGEDPAVLIPRGSRVVYPMLGGVYTVTEEDGSRYSYGVSVYGEEPTVYMQTAAELRFVFALAVARDESGTWQDVSTDEGDLLGMIWTTVSEIDGVSHDLPVQGTRVVRVAMGDGWADVKLGTGDGWQVAQVVAFSEDLRPAMAEFMESFGIAGDLLDTMLGEGVPVAETPMAPGVHIEEPQPILDDAL